MVWWVWLGLLVQKGEVEKCALPRGLSVEKGEEEKKRRKEEKKRKEEEEKKRRKEGKDEEQLS